MARVLVVEDTVANWELMELLIRKAGHEAVHAENGEQALERLLAGGIDLTYVDIYLPAMDGYELIRQVRRNEQLAAGRYVAVTALTMDGDREKIMSAGFDDYISKPIDAELLFADLKRLAESEGGSLP